MDISKEIDIKPIQTERNNYRKINHEVKNNSKERSKEKNQNLRETKKKNDNFNFKVNNTEHYAKGIKLIKYDNKEEKHYFTKQIQNNSKLNSYRENCNLVNKINFTKGKIPFQRWNTPIKEILTNRTYRQKEGKIKEEYSFVNKKIQNNSALLIKEKKTIKIFKSSSAPKTNKYSSAKNIQKYSNESHKIKDLRSSSFKGTNCSSNKSSSISKKGSSSNNKYQNLKEKEVDCRNVNYFNFKILETEIPKPTKRQLKDNKTQIKVRPKENEEKIKRNLKDVKIIEIKFPKYISSSCKKINRTNTECLTYRRNSRPKEKNISQKVFQDNRSKINIKSFLKIKCAGMSKYVANPTEYSICHSKGKDLSKSIKLNENIKNQGKTCYFKKIMTDYSRKVENYTNENKNILNTEFNRPVYFSLFKKK
ncbi:MAG: hypothetical protein MJ252_04255 [archaeon]|nr:hypothetical protein [archaeon]